MEIIMRLTWLGHAALIKSDVVVPMHYNTFSPIEQNPKEFKNLVESVYNSGVLIWEPGKTYEV
jgi:L-ascorbate metabolism protein UlaG (beta-lactamase superfamily)